MHQACFKHHRHYRRDKERSWAKALSVFPFKHKLRPGNGNDKLEGRFLCLIRTDHGLFWPVFLPLQWQGFILQHSHSTHKTVYTDLFVRELTAVWLVRNYINNWPRYLSSGLECAAGCWFRRSNPIKPLWSCDLVPYMKIFSAYYFKTREPLQDFKRQASMPPQWKVLASFCCGRAVYKHLLW